MHGEAPVVEKTNLRPRFLLIGLITVLLVWALLGMGVRLGQDLRGGTTLRFSLDLDRAEQEGRIATNADRDKIVASTIKVIRDRVDKYGLSETLITPLGETKFEISLPAGSEGEVQSIVDVVTALGNLIFRIEVLPTHRYGRRGDDRPAPRLAQKASHPWQGTDDEFDAFKKSEVEKFKLARDTATAYVPTRARYFVVPKDGTDEDALSDFVVLEQPENATFRFDGGILKNPRTGKDEKGKPCVLYDVKTDFQNVFSQWTGENVGLPMAIVLNEKFNTAPVINSALSDSVQITLGSGRPWNELEKEAENITTILQTGSLKVRPKLESVNKVGARLAGESKQRGILAVIVAFGLVLVFMVVYYRAQGLVANLALILNLVLLMGTVAFFQAVLTLPGIAGIVLTLGMAVDANILICERIREERNAGRSLQRAVSEGYDRALTTIVDANVTSLITAIFLYTYGSGPVRGFAITLAIGLVISMFTSIFVTRTVNDWFIFKGWFTDINMLGSGRPPKISWVGMRRFFAPLSALGVVFGLLVFAGEDEYTLYDVDFTGGFKMQARFETPTTVDDVRSALTSGTRTVDITTDDFEEGTRTTVHHRIEAGPYPAAEVVAVGPAGEGAEITVQRGLIQDDVPAEDRLSLEVQSGAFEAYVREVLADRLRPDWLRDGPSEYHAPEDAGEELEALDDGMAFTVTLVDPGNIVTPDRLRKALADDMPFWTWRGTERERRPANLLDRTVVVRADEEETHPILRTFHIWMKSVNPASGKTVEKRPKELRETISQFLGGKGFRSSLEAQGLDTAEIDRVGISEPFPSVDVIGSSVARGLKNDAIIALALSLLGIIVYIALRFRSRAMGFAAVICLFHDVSITLGIVAVANLLEIVDAKINLPMIAAFLTLVGYSVNDTVVVFDRIRENRGKKRVITANMIDLSINQTLARTIKTSITFLLACTALFAINVGQRNVLEGFAFLLIIGSVIGTYSTVAIASPLLLYLPWLWERIRRFRPRAALVARPANHYLTLIFVPVAGILWTAWALLFTAFAFLLCLLLFPVWALGEKIAVEPAMA